MKIRENHRLKKFLYDLILLLGTIIKIIIGILDQRWIKTFLCWIEPFLII